MKPIPTIYKGIRYRSRTEARWAVFFDALGLKVRYEPEGYQLDGVTYLVDFMVPEWDVFLEVKSAEEPAEEEMEKCRLLSAAQSKSVLLVNGAPASHRAYLWMKGAQKAGAPTFNVSALIPCRRCDRVTVYEEHTGTGGHPNYWSWIELGPGRCTRVDCGDRRPVENENWRLAIQKSEDERFGVYE